MGNHRLTKFCWLVIIQRLKHAKQNLNKTDPLSLIHTADDTDEENDVAIKMLFQFDIDTEDKLHIYTNGLDDSLRNELLAYFDECNVQYETE